MIRCTQPDDRLPTSDSSVFNTPAHITAGRIGAMVEVLGMSRLVWAGRP
jgi:hypothetical protein